MKTLEVVNHESGSEAPSFCLIKTRADLCDLRFDCRDRLWLSTMDGFVEIIDLARSAKKLEIVRNFMFRQADKITKSRLLF